MSRPAAPAAVTFDVWYTLLYLTRTSGRAYEAARRAAWHDALAGPGLPSAAVRERVRAMEVEGRRREAAGAAFTLAQQGRWVRRTPPVDLARLDRALRRAIRLLEVRVAPGALSVLERLREQGIALALVSNVIHEPTPEIHRILGATGLRRRVDAIVLSNELGAAKPSPRPVRVALRALGIRPADALHFGDSDYDLLAAWRAGAAGARYVGLARYWPPAPPRPPEFPRVPIPSVARWADLAPGLGRLYARARRVADAARQASA